MDEQHTDFVTPQALPPVIDEQAGAIELYRIAIFALAAHDGGGCRLPGHGA